jgi:hypothetical protein
VEKNLHANKDSTEKRPKTELDGKFLVTIQELMAKRGIRSDRAMSLELGRSPDFLNRVRNGYQSATPEAWDALFTSFPEARDITNNVTADRIGQVIGTNHGIATQNSYPADQEKPSDTKQPDIVIMTDTQMLIIELKSHNEQLKSQLADKERIIKLLEQSLNKPS